jgi:hypothetical protein
MAPPPPARNEPRTAHTCAAHRRLTAAGAAGDHNHDGMVPRRDRIVLWAFTLVLAAWMVAQALTGTETGLLYLAPALVLALPLVLGRYLGEEQLAELAGTSRARRARLGARVWTPRDYVRVMHRGGHLVASAMAKRPPPAPALLTA